MLPRPFGDEEPDEEPVGRATLKRQSQDILNQAVERRELVGEGGATAPGNRIHRGMENSGTNQRRDPMYACSPAGSFPPSLPPPSCSGQPALVGGPPMMWRGMTPDTRGGGGHGGGGGGGGGGGSGYGGGGYGVGSYGVGSYGGGRGGISGGGPGAKAPPANLSWNITDDLMHQPWGERPRTEPRPPAHHEAADATAWHIPSAHFSHRRHACALAGSVLRTLNRS